jgi:transaldolase
MAIFLDSADLDQARRALALGYVRGVTTNPMLVARTGRRGLDILDDLLALTDGSVFYQVTAERPDQRAAQAREASARAPQRVVIKIPAASDNFPLAAALADSGVRCAITAVSSPAQAYLAAQVGADYAIPYVHRLTAQQGDGVAVLRDVAAVVRGTRTRPMAASLKTADEVVAAVLAGAEDVTLPLELILALGDHPLSAQAIAEFAAAGAR